MNEESKLYRSTSKLCTCGARRMLAHNIGCPLREPEVSPFRDVGLKETLLNKRGKTHGVYAEQAALTQSHRAVLRSHKGWEQLNNVQRDALEMISVKISRIIAGNAGHPDHWEDIAGYATLAANSGIDPSG